MSSVDRTMSLQPQKLDLSYNTLINKYGKSDLYTDLLDACMKKRYTKSKITEINKVAVNVLQIKTDTNEDHIIIKHHNPLTMFFKRVWAWCSKHFPGKHKLEKAATQLSHLSSQVLVNGSKTREPSRFSETHTQFKPPIVQDKSQVMSPIVQDKSQGAAGAPAVKDRDEAAKSKCAQEVSPVKPEPKPALTEAEIKQELLKKCADFFDPFSNPLANAPKSLLKDKEFMLAAIKGGTNNAPFVKDYDKGYLLLLKNQCDELRNDPDFMFQVLDYYRFSYCDYHLDIFHRCSEELRNNRDFVLKILSTSKAAETEKEVDYYGSDLFRERCNQSKIYIHMGKSLFSDPKFMAALNELGCKTDWGDLDMIYLKMAKQYNSPLLKDPKFMISTIQKYGAQALEYAHPVLLNDGNFMLPFIETDGLLLKYAGDELKKDANIVLAAVEQNGLALEFADESMKNDKVIVTAAITQMKKLSFHLGAILKQDAAFAKEMKDLVKKLNSE